MKKKGGGQKFQKIWKEQRSESEIVPLKFSPIFLPKSGEEQTKRSSLKFSPIFCPKLGEEQKKKNKKKRSSLKFSKSFCPKLGEEQKKTKNGLHSYSVRFFAQSLEETHNTCPLCDQTSCPTCKGGGPCLNFAYFSMQFYNPDEPKGGSWHNAPPKYAPGQFRNTFKRVHFRVKFLSDLAGGGAEARFALVVSPLNP